MNDRVTITLHKKNKRGAGGPGRKDPGSRRRANDPLQRRHKASGINFYDMGQVANGSGGWIDTAEYFLNTAIAGVSIVPAVLGSSLFEVRDGHLFEIPTANWKSKFRRISKGALSGKYSLTASFGAFSDTLDNLSQWKATGLEVEQSDLDSGLYLDDSLNQVMFDSIGFIDGQPNIKITGTNDYSGGPVAFTPAPAMDIFLPPKLNRLEGSSSTNLQNPNPYQWYSYDLITFPRDFLINDTKLYLASCIFLTDVPNGAKFLEALGNWKALIPGRDFHYDIVSDVWSVGGTMPPTGISGGGIPETLVMNVDPGEGSPAFVGVNGALLAVVKKGNNFYYFWSDGY